MPRIPDLEQRFGLTRGDVTVALFLAATALAGFIYVTFFDERDQLARRDLARLVAYRDSALAARREAAERRMLGIAGADSSGGGDSLAAWEPLDEEALRRDTLRGTARAASGGGKTLPSAPVDINHASLAELTRLPGVGEKTARGIMELRVHVPFRRVEDLLSVKGIGAKKLAKMRPYVVVR